MGAKGRMSRIAGLAAIVFLAGSGTAAAATPDIVWSGTITESHVWTSADNVVNGYPCNQAGEGHPRWGIRTEWTIGGSSARSASPPDPNNPGSASSYRVGPPEVEGIPSGGVLPCYSALYCIGVMVVPGAVRTEVFGTRWSPRLTYDPVTGKLAVDSLPPPSPEGSVTGEVDHMTSYPPITECSGSGGTTTVSGVGLPNRVNQGPQDLPLEDYRLPTTLGNDGSLRVQINPGAELIESGSHLYRSSGPRGGFSFNAFDQGGFIHSAGASGGSLEVLETALSADLVGTCSDAAASLCGRLGSVDARKHARQALIARYGNRYSDGRDKQLSCKAKSSGTFKCPVSWRFKTKQKSVSYAGSVTVSGEPSDPKTVLTIRRP